MTTTTIAYFGIGVFILMAIGIILTMVEFTRLTKEPSADKDPRESAAAPQNRSQAEMRLVGTHNDTA